MRERAALSLFLLAVGGIKWYEYRSEEWEDGEFEHDYEYAKKKTKLQKRSLDIAKERWKMHDYQEELIEVFNGASFRSSVDCSSVPEDICACKFLMCFGSRTCERNITFSPSHVFMRCRSTVMFEQTLCECKRYTKLSNKLSESHEPHDKQKGGFKFKRSQLSDTDSNKDPLPVAPPQL